MGNFNLQDRDEIFQCFNNFFLSKEKSIFLFATWCRNILGKNRIQGNEDRSFTSENETNNKQIVT